MEKLVSIIVPVYNCENKIERCIKSLINQTYKNIEIIMINDGSKDKSEEIILKFKKKDNRIKYFYHNNRGPSYTRNVGLDNMNGEYYTFVDADDYLDEKFVEIMISFLEKNDADFVTSLPFLFKNEKELSERRINYNINEEILYGKNSWENFAIDDFLISVWGKLYKTITYRNIRFDENIRNTEDKLYIFECLKITNKYVNLDYNGYCYYVSNKSLSKLFDENVINNLLCVAKEINEFILKVEPEYKDIPISLTLLYICRNSLVFNKYSENKSVIKKLFKEHKKDKIRYKLIKNKRNRIELRIIKKSKIMYIYLYHIYRFLKLLLK